MAESGVQDPAASSAQDGPNASPAPGTISWTAPLDWLEQLLPTSPVLADLRRGLPVGAPQEEEEGGTHTLEPGATASPAPPGSHGSPCLAPALLQGHHTSTPVSGTSAGAWATPLSSQDLGAKTPPEPSPAPLPGSAAPEADATASPVGQELPVQCQDPGTAHISLPGCRCHGLWGSPLSVLDDGPRVSPAGTDPSWPGPKRASPSPACPACAQACSRSGNLPRKNQGTSVTPVSLASVAACTSQLSFREAGINTSPAEKATTTDSTAETDSLLWHCSRDQLSGLSRAELEGRLQSTLIIMEALSHQIRAAQDFRPTAARVGPADQRDAATQTPTPESNEEERLYHNLYQELRLRFQSLQESQQTRQRLARWLEGASEEMRAWASGTRQLQATVEASFQHLQDDRRSLQEQQRQLGRLLVRTRAQVQSWGQKQRAAAREQQAALKAKEAATLVLESLQTSASAKIRTLELSAESRRRLWVLLQEATALKEDLLLECGRHVAQGDSLATALQADWAQMRLDYQGCRSAVASCLVAHRKMAEEVEAARIESARHQEVCQKLEERTVELVEALGRVTQLVETNRRLDQDLQATLEKVTALEYRLEQLQEEHLALTQQLEEKRTTVQQLQDETARLAQEKERVQQERESAQRDFREASDCREFLEQENQVARRQLSETEQELKASLATLRERSSLLEDLKDAHRKLQQEQESLAAELAGARAELRDMESGLGGLSRAVQELGGLHAQCLGAADILRTALPGEAAQVAPPSSTRTPGRPPSQRPGLSLVDSVLRAASQEAKKTPGLWSETTAFMLAAPAPPPQPSEIEASLASHTQDLRLALEQLRLLARCCQEDIRERQAQSLRLEQRLEMSQTEHQAEMDACNATQAKLSKALHQRIQSEKELRELLRQQGEKQFQLSDQRRELVTLREEVALLKEELQKSETAATALLDELSGSRWPDVQEKIWLRQEVEKLKELLLQKDTDHTKALTSHVLQVRSLEERLCQAQQLLRHQEKTEAKLKQLAGEFPDLKSTSPPMPKALSTLPAEVSSLTEVQHLVNLFL